MEQMGRSPQREPSLRQRFKEMFIEAGMGMLIGVAVAGGVLVVHKTFIEEQEAAEPPAPAEAPPAEETEPSVPETIPETLEEVPLGGEFLANGGVVIRKSRSIGIDCIESYGSPDTNGSPKSAETWWPVTLENGHFLRDPEPLVFLGEETEEPVLGLRALSDGWALSYDSTSGMYSLYRFEAKERTDQGIFERFPESFRGETVRGVASGRLIAELTFEDLREGVTLRDEHKALSVRIIDPGKVPAGAAGPLRVTMACIGGST